MPKGLRFPAYMTLSWLLLAQLLYLSCKSIIIKKPSILPNDNSLPEEKNIAILPSDIKSVNNQIQLEQDQIPNKLDRSLYIAKRKKKRPFFIPKEMSYKDKRDIKGFLGNIRTKRALHAYLKSKNTKIKFGKKDKFAKFKFHVGDFNNVYNITHHLYQEEKIKTDYDKISARLNKIAHNYDIFGIDSREDKFVRHWGVVRPKIGNPSRKFISKQVDSKTWVYKKPYTVRQRLKNENIPDINKTLRQMYAKIIAKRKAMKKKKPKIRRRRKPRRTRRRRKRRRKKRRKKRRRKRRRRKKKRSLLEVQIERDLLQKNTDADSLINSNKKLSDNTIIPNILNTGIGIKDNSIKNEPQNKTEMIQTPGQVIDKQKKQLI